MLQHGMTPQNKENARRNGEEQFRKMMKALGYEKIQVVFEDSDENN